MRLWQFKLFIEKTKRWIPWEKNWKQQVGPPFLHLSHRICKNKTIPINTNLKQGRVGKTIFKNFNSTHCLISSSNLASSSALRSSTLSIFFAISPSAFFSTGDFVRSKQKRKQILYRDNFAIIGFPENHSQRNCHIC